MRPNTPGLLGFRGGVPDFAGHQSHLGSYQCRFLGLTSRTFSFSQLETGPRNPLLKLPDVQAGSRYEALGTCEKARVSQEFLQHLGIMTVATFLTVQKWSKNFFF